MSDGVSLSPGRLIEEAGHVLSGIVPPEAQLHLLNAQRELLLAMAITIEHNAARATPRKRAARATKSGARRKSPSSRRPKSVTLD